MSAQRSPVALCHCMCKHLGMAFDSNTHPMFRKNTKVSLYKEVFIKKLGFNKYQFNRLVHPFLMEEYPHRMGVLMLQVVAKEQPSMARCKLLAATEERW